MLIIAVGHRRFVGKDTFCKFVATHVRFNLKNKTIRIAGFSDELKLMCHRLYGWAGLKHNHYYEENPQAKDDFLPLLNKTVRNVWIEFGQHCKKYDDKIWINALLKNQTQDLLLIKDLRFQSEAEEIISENGVLVKIENDQIKMSDDEADSNLANYQGWHYIFKNNGTIHELNKIAADFTEKIILPKLK